MAKYTVTAEMQTKGFDNGAKSVKSQISSLSSLGNTLSKSFNITGDFSKAKSGMDALRQGSTMAQSEVGRLSKNLELLKMSGAPADQIRQMETELNRAQATSQRLKNSEDNLANAVENVGQKAEKSSEGFTVLKGAMANLVSSGIEKTIGAIGNGLSTLGSGVVNLGKNVLASYANYEQLVGGVDTLFNSSSKAVQDNAAKAFQTAGMSANDYMENVTSFSASLISSVGGDTKKATDIADMAIRDMSDNANKMGSDMESITGTYQSLAKGNYAMLDNLKLGFGGTKGEMERLLETASAMPEAMGKKFDISNYGDVIQAIHLVQENMGITGTTAKEAAETIEGSVNTTKAAWQNLLTGLGDSKADLGPLVQNVIDSAVNVVNNATPIIENLFKSLPNAFKNLIEQIPGLIDILLPAVQNIIIELGRSISAAVPMLAQSLRDNLAGLLTELIDGLKLIVEALAVAIPPLIPIIGQAFIQLFTAFLEVLPTIINNLVPAVAELINQLVNAIPPLIPLLVDAFITLFNALVTALPTIINNLVPQIPVIINALIDALPTMLDALINGFVTLFIALVEATPTIIRTLVPEIPKIIKALADAFAHAVDTLSDGFSTMWDIFVAAIPSIVSGIGDAFKDIGTWIWNGMVDGLNGVWRDFNDWVSNLGSHIASSVGDALGGLGGLFSLNGMTDGLGVQGMGGPDMRQDPTVLGGFGFPLPMALQMFASGGLPTGNIINGLANARNISPTKTNNGTKNIYLYNTFSGNDVKDGGMKAVVNMLRKNGYTIRYTG